uniref:Uncharacterized protein n=1 Tax=Euplotes crassus TaxID=5936 RepID=A0A7S3NXM6_EUPCR|mmetsp:Transcript_32611/g.31983  ORF Transcript_32611/g.31983 Transcript_32611/m.31983 type:complete len:227 (+) Transcript_32611:603-1283(+)
MNKIIDEYLKPRLLEVWDPKLLYNQRTMNDLIVEFKKLNYYDEEIFEKIIDSLLVKKRIQNIYLFETFHQFMNEVNENPKGSLYQKWTEKINQFEEKHYTADFKWRYNAEERRRRTHKELVARRDEFDWEDFVEVETTDEREERERKRIEEEQQRKYSVYNKELFVKQVKKYRAEGKTMIEMMVYLDVDEEALENAFQAISQEEQLERLEELRKENKLPFAEGTTV